MILFIFLAVLVIMLLCQPEVPHEMIEEAREHLGEQAEVL